MIDLIRNQPKRVIVPLNRVNGFTSSITLSAQAPLGVSVGINPQPGTDSTSTLTLTALNGASLGQGQIIVTGNPPAKNNSVVIQINVQEGTTTTTEAPTSTTTTTLSPTTTQTPFSANAVIYTYYESGRRYRFKGEVTYNSSYPVEYSWYINDTGTTLYGQEIDYTFASNGTYVVSLSVRFANNQYAYASVGPVVSSTDTTTTTTTVAPTTTQASTTTTSTTTTTTVDATKVDTYRNTTVSLTRTKASSSSYQSTWTFTNSLQNTNGQNVKSYYSLEVYSVGTDPDTGGEMITPLGNLGTGSSSIDIILSKAYNYGLEVNVLRNGTRIGTFTVAKSSINWSTGQSNTENIPVVWTIRA